MAQPNLQQRKTLERDSQKNEDRLGQKGHDPGCQCSACGGKNSAISDILAGQVVLDQKPRMVGHEPGCQCDSCSGKSNAINDLLNGNVKVDPAPKMAGHEPGCQCDSCSGKSSSIDDILKGNVVVDSSPKMAGHEPGCQCQACGGKGNAITDIIEGNVLLERAVPQTPTQMTDSPIIVGVKSNSADIVQVVRDSTGNRQTAMVGALQESASNRLGWQVGASYTEASLNATDETRTSRQKSELQEIKIANPTRAIAQDDLGRGENTQTEPTAALVDRKNYVVGNYAYEDILTIPWLRKLYGHLIGLGALEESSEQKKENNPERPRIRAPKKKTAKDDPPKGEASLRSAPPLSNPITNPRPQELKDSETVTKMKSENSYLISSFESKKEGLLHQLNIKLKRAESFIESHRAELKKAENLLKGYKDELKVLVKEMPRNLPPKLAKELAIVKARLRKLEDSINAVKLQNMKEKKALSENEKIKIPKKITSIVRSVGAGKKKLALKKLSKKELKKLEGVLREKKILMILLGPKAFRRKLDVLKTLLALIRKLLR
jgi:hypothetical protein